MRPLVLLAVATIVVGCTDDPAGPSGSPPIVTFTAVSEAGGPIFRSVEIHFDDSAGARVEYWSEEAPRLRLENAEAAAEHELFLGRLRAEHTYQYEIRAVDPGGQLGAAVTGSFSTGPLPDDLREIELSTIGVPTYPLTMMEAVAPTRPSHPFIVDRQGHIVWYHAPETSSSGFTRLNESDFAFLTAEGLSVVTPGHEVVAQLSRADAAARTGIEPFRMHHDVIRSPDNTLLVLVHDTTVVSDTVWTGEAIWEWDPVSDRLEKRWASKDFFDPRVDRGDRTIPEDWLHANSLAVGPRGNILVSSFWLHEVFSIAPDFGTIEWRLGGPASSFDVEDDAMEAGQHTAAEVAPNRVLMFDNGRERSRGLYSRALEMEIDQDGGAATVAWEFRPRPDIYAPIVSSARRLENGNTVVGFGLAADFRQGSSGPVSVFEVTPDSRVLWRLEVVSGVDLMYRATPLFTISGERIVGEEGG